MGFVLSMRALALLLILVGCESSGGWTGKTPEPPPPADLGVPPPPADQSVPRDMLPPADLAPLKCNLTGTGPRCPTDYLCHYDGICRPCGLYGVECCMDKMSDNYCAAGLRCSGCSVSAYGPRTRCETNPCGAPGWGCCWRWEPWINKDCGLGPAYEYCAIGTCVDHKCVMKP